MPLDHENGEILEDRDFVFRVVPVEKYMNLPRLTTLVRETTGNKFKREITVQRSIWEAAFGLARTAFTEAGAPAGTISYDVIVQEYPREHVVAFVFCMTIRGEERFVTAPFQLTAEQIGDLIATNQWEMIPVN